MSDQLIVLSGVGVYVVGMLIVGALASRRVKDSDDFIVAGRRLPLWLCSATLFATWMGAGTTMGAAGAAYEGGMLGVIADPFGAGVCLLLAGLFVVRMMRRMRLLTIASFFEIKFGPTAGMLSAVVMIFVYIGWTGAQLVAFGFILQALAGVSATTGILVASAIVLSYTSAGGMWAVTMTDFVQMVILMAGFVMMLPIVVGDLGGWQAAYSALPAGSLRIIPAEGGFATWLNYARDWAVIGIGSIASQDLMQRAMSAKNENVAQNSAYLAGIGYLTVGVIPVLLGVLGVLVLPELADPELILPQLALHYLHPLALAIFVGALLAAIMSSADSALLVPASVLSANIIPYFYPNASPAVRLAWARYSVPVFGVGALGIALYVQAVYVLMVDSFSALLVSIFVPVVAGVWWSKSNRFGALASMIGGAVVWIASLVLFPELPSDMLGLAASAVLLLVVTPLTQRIDPPQPLRDIDGNLLPLGDRLGVLSPFDRVSRLASEPRS